MKDDDGIDGFQATVAPSVMMILKQQTRVQHETIENTMAPLLDGVTRHSYLLMLQRLFGYYQPLEANIADLPEWRDLSPDAFRREKAHLLVKDLRHLRLSPEECCRLPRCERLPEIKDVTHALGCLYVLEGATLGGQVILRHLRQHIGVEADWGGSFFASYGENVGSMWKAFGLLVNERCMHPDAQDILVRVARETFDTMNSWLVVGQPELREKDGDIGPRQPFLR